MPSAAPITLTDANAVDHIYTPIKNGLDAIYRNADNTISAGRSDISAKIDLASARRATDHVTFKESYPKEVTVDGVVVVKDTSRVETKFIFSDSLSDVEREDILAKHRDLLSETVVTSNVKDLEPIY